MDEAVVIVGAKLADRYILARLLHIHDGAKKDSTKARGKAISNACIVAERLKNDYMQELEYEDVRIFTECIRNEKTGRITRGNEHRDNSFHKRLPLSKLYRLV